MTDTTTEPATNYHATVDDLRRSLVASSVAWDGMSGDHPAAVMATVYSYTLAAVLKVAQREFGEEAARTLAFEADELLTNGDSDDLNADVMPEETV